jgi:hypothetical protein
VFYSRELVFCFCSGRETCLHYAVRGGNEAVVKVTTFFLLFLSLLLAENNQLLLDRGVDASVAGSDGTAYELAVAWKKENVMEVLRDWRPLPPSPVPSLRVKKKNRPLLSQSSTNTDTDTADPDVDDGEQCSEVAQ